MRRKIVLSDDKIHQGCLLLVNAACPLKRENTGDLISVSRDFPQILLRRDAARMLNKVLEKISAGNAIVPVSGYRSEREQTDIYQTSLVENGELFTRQFVALPNHSEHQTGLAIDLGFNRGEIDFIRPDFPYEGICQTFRETAVDYGFIERYREEKEEITGISHEPWHFRYVGRPHSQIMQEDGLSMEEYIALLREHPMDSPMRCSGMGGAEAEVYYVPAQGEETLITLPEECICRISGNNLDGFIVTAWRKKE